MLVAKGRGKPCTVTVRGKQRPYLHRNDLGTIGGTDLLVAKGRGKPCTVTVRGKQRPYLHVSSEAP